LIRFDSVLIYTGVIAYSGSTALLVGVWLLGEFFSSHGEDIRSDVRGTSTMERWSWPRTATSKLLIGSCDFKNKGDSALCERAKNIRQYNMAKGFGSDAVHIRVFTLDKLLTQ